MKFYKISMESIVRSITLLKAEAGSHFSYYYFKSCIMSTRYKSGIILSTKSPIPSFYGCVQSDLFSSITDIKANYLRIGLTNNYTLKIESGSQADIELQLDPAEHKKISLNLWDSSIEWYPCCQNLIEGMSGAADMPFKGSDIPEDIDFAYTVIHIAKGYVVASDYNFFRGSRYKLSCPLPFNISISPVDIKQTFRRLKGKKLLGVAKVKEDDCSNARHGMALNFGEIRIWLPGIELDVNGCCSVHYAWKNIVNNVNRILNVSCEFIIIIPDHINNRIPPRIKDNQSNYRPLSLTFGHGKINFLYEVDGFSSEDDCTTNNYLPRLPISINVNSTHFIQAITGKNLLGLIDMKDIGHKFIYFKNKRLEYFIKAL